MVNRQALLISLSAIPLALSIIPAIHFIKVKDVCCIFVYFWIVTELILFVINASIWGGSNFRNVWDGKGYCDLYVYFIIMTTQGMICAVFGMALRVNSIFRGKGIIRLTKKKQNIIYILICTVQPAILLPINYAIMSFRYGILRYDGCTQIHNTSILSLIFLGIIPLLWAVATFFISAWTLIHYFRHRLDARNLSVCVNAGLSFARLWRIILFCIICVFLEIPVTVMLVIGNTAPTFDNNFSKDSHNLMYNYVVYYLHESPLYSKWIVITMSFLVFILHGLGKDLVKSYKKAFIYLGMGPVIRWFDNYIEKCKEAKFSNAEDLNLEQIFGLKETNGNESLNFSHNSSYFCDPTIDDEFASTTSISEKDLKLQNVSVHRILDEEQCIGLEHISTKGSDDYYCLREIKVKRSVGNGLTLTSDDSSDDAYGKVLSEQRSVD